ncbi:MAG: amidohydrolase family protein [Deltaproteobacteria bacterium]|nr:amidohydrolase family protein [Deltaproteobacteria bacterium]
MPTGARTAAMLAPYVPHPSFPDGYTGVLHVDEYTLTTDIAQLEKRGFTVKLHTAGDRSVRVALNAIERAHKISGRADLRHELAHAGFIDPLDIPRFRALNVVADLSPYIWYPSPINAAIVNAVGERAHHYWPIRDLLEAGAPLLAGSDWPAAVASMDPWIGIEAMVTRQDPTRATPGSVWSEQAVSLEQVLPIFTVAGAYALRRDHVTGSLRVGKSADVIVLDRNLFTIDLHAIANTVVEMTLFAGRVVYQSHTD